MVIYGSDDVSLKQQSKNTTRQTKQSERAKESDDDPKACQELTTPTETKRQNESDCLAKTKWQSWWRTQIQVLLILTQRKTSWCPVGHSSPVLVNLYGFCPRLPPSEWPLLPLHCTAWSASRARTSQSFWRTPSPPWAWSVPAVPLDRRTQTSCLLTGLHLSADCLSHYLYNVSMELGWGCC